MRRLYSGSSDGGSKEGDVNKPEAPLEHPVNTSTSWLSRGQVAAIREAGHSFPRMTHRLTSLLEVATTYYGTRPYRADPLQRHDISSTLLSASQSGPSPSLLISILASATPPSRCPVPSRPSLTLGQAAASPPPATHPFLHDRHEPR